MQRKIQLCFYDPAWHFLMRWIPWCCQFFNYGKEKYCNPRSNINILITKMINILITKMSGVWDRSRSLVMSHVRVMLGRSIDFYISICISTLRTQHTTFIRIHVDFLLWKRDQWCKRRLEWQLCIFWGVFTVRLPMKQNRWKDETTLMVEIGPWGDCSQSQVLKHKEYLTYGSTNHKYCKA